LSPLSSLRECSVFAGDRLDDGPARVTGNPDTTSATSSRGKEAADVGAWIDEKRTRRPVSLPDLDQAKSAVLNTLGSADAQRG
jgi:hypothetical protein